MAAPTRSPVPPAAVESPESHEGRAVELSIVVPVYNEAENIGELYREATAAASDLGRTYEIIVVDDGSNDGTYAKLTKLAASDPTSR